MRNQKSEVGTILTISRLNLSVNGNPRFAITYQAEDGTIHHRITTSDASCSYEIGNPGRRVDSRVRFYLTRAGRISYVTDAA
jgi:hypothetical protein